MEQRREFIPPRPDFDVPIVAGDVCDDIAESIDFTAAIADGKPAIFVAGNHLFWDYSTAEVALDAGREAASRCSVTFLERSIRKLTVLRQHGLRPALMAEFQKHRS